MLLGGYALKPPDTQAIFSGPDSSQQHVDVMHWFNLMTQAERTDACVSMICYVAHLQSPALAEHGLGSFHSHTYARKLFRCWFVLGMCETSCSSISLQL